MEMFSGAYPSGLPFLLLSIDAFMLLVDRKLRASNLSFSKKLLIELSIISLAIVLIYVSS